MVIGAIKITLRLHGVKSLKEKRSIIKRTREGIRNHFNASVAETGHHDVHDSAQIGVVIVGNDKSHINSKADYILNYVENNSLAEMIDHEIELITL